VDVCVCEGFVMCGRVCVCVSVGFVICVSVCVCVGFVMFGCFANKYSSTLRLT